MTKLIKISLISAVLATGAMASELNGNLAPKGDFTVNTDYTIGTNGQLTMQSSYAIIVDSDATLANKGTIDLTDVRDFSRFSGVVEGAGDSQIKLPGVDVGEITKCKDEMTYNGGKLVYDSTAALAVDGTSVAIKVADPIDIGITFTSCTNDPTFKAMTMETVIADPENATKNIDKVFNISAAITDKYLESADLSLDEAASKIIHFGLSGSNDMTIERVPTLTIRGDCAGLSGDITTDGSLTFQKAGSCGMLKVDGTLSFGDSTTVKGIECGSLNVTAGKTLTVDGPITIGKVYKFKFTGGTGTYTTDYDDGTYTLTLDENSLKVDETLISSTSSEPLSAIAAASNFPNGVINYAALKPHRDENGYADLWALFLAIQNGEALPYK